MYKYHLGNNIKLGEAITNLWKLKFPPKSEFPTQESSFHAFLPSFFSFLSLVSCLFFYDFCALSWLSIVHENQLLMAEEKLLEKSWSCFKFMVKNCAKCTNQNKPNFYYLDQSSFTILSTHF